ncbi:MAG: hypothetical protein GTO14_09400 [Anaerolineales bacterium]|nr:hypothetical protein [Anaerolineales bacterium]
MAKAPTADSEPIVISRRQVSELLIDQRFAFWRPMRFSNHAREGDGDFQLGPLEIRARVRAHSWQQHYGWGVSAAGIAKSY